MESSYYPWVKQNLDFCKQIKREKLENDKTHVVLAIFLARRDFAPIPGAWLARFPRVAWGTTTWAAREGLWRGCTIGESDMGVVVRVTILVKANQLRVTSRDIIILIII